MKSQFLMAFVLAVFAANAQARQLNTVREYCKVVEVRIANLAEAEASSNTAISKYATDQPTADAKKFKDARDKLESFSESLKQNEEEWLRLECAHILYPSSK